MAALVQPKTADRQALGGLPEYLPAYCGDFDALIQRVNSIASADGAVKADTIAEYTSGAGVTITGQRAKSLVNTATATATLTASQSGTTFFLSKADGIAYTLPAATAANVGVYYYFIVTTDVTSNAYSVTAASSSDLYKGAIMTSKSGTQASAAPNGSSNYIITMNGSTTGGLKGTVLEFICTAANTWYVTGTYVYTGTLGTVFTG